MIEGDIIVCIDNDKPNWIIEKGISKLTIGKSYTISHLVK